MRVTSHIARLGQNGEGEHAADARNRLQLQIVAVVAEQRSRLCLQRASLRASVTCRKVFGAS